MSAKHPAAFINVIAEDGTKAEAVEWLQKTWNELCDIKDIVKNWLEDRSSGSNNDDLREHQFRKLGIRE